MASSLFPLIIGIFRWKKVDAMLRYFIFFLLITVIQIGIEYTLGRMKIPTHVLTDFYTAFEATFLLLLFRLFVRSNLKKIIFLIFIALDLAVFIFSYIHQNNEPQFNTLLLLLTRVVLIFGAMSVIHSIVTEKVNTVYPIYKYSIFWIAAGVLIYCTGSVLVLSLGNEIMKLGIDYFFAIWKINWSFFIIANILFSFSFFVSTQ